MFLVTFGHDSWSMEEANYELHNNKIDTVYFAQQAVILLLVSYRVRDWYTIGLMPKWAADVVEGARVGSDVYQCTSAPPINFNCWSESISYLCKVEFMQNFKFCAHEKLLK